MVVAMGRQACQLRREIFHACHPCTQSSHLCTESFTFVLSTLKPPSQALSAWSVCLPEGMPAQLLHSE